MLSPVYIRPLLALLVMAAIVGIVTTVSRHGSQESVPVQSTNQALPHNIDVSLKKARFSEIKDGLVAWELVAEQADYDKEGNIAYLSDIIMIFKHTGSQGAVTVTADRGEYSSTAKTVRLNGNVHGVTEEDVSFNTSSILYSGTKAQFITDEAVIFRQQRLQLTAVGMELGVKNQRAHFLSSVNAAIIQDVGVK